MYDCSLNVFYLCAFSYPTPFFLYLSTSLSTRPFISLSLRIKNLLTPPPPLPFPPPLPATLQRTPRPRRPIQTLLHPIRNAPPAPHLLILAHPAHIAPEVRAGVLERREQQRRLRVVEAAVVVDVAGGDARQDGGPDLAVQGDVFAGVGGEETDDLGVAVGGG